MQPGIISGIICAAFYITALCAPLHATSISSLPDGSAQVSTNSVVPIDVTLGGTTKRVTIGQLLAAGATSGSYFGIFTGHFTGDLTGTSTGLFAQYIDWNAVSGPTSIKNKPTITPGGEWLGTTVLTTPGAGTFITNASTNRIKVTVVGGGGPGGCTTSAAASSAAASGGSGGAIGVKWFTVTGGTSYSYYVAGGGTHGNNDCGGSVATQVSGPSTFTVSGATASAGSGYSGYAMAHGTAVVIYPGGVAASCSGVDYCQHGRQGAYGLRESAAVAVSGRGGDSLGSGGPERTTAGTGSNGSAYGGGGGGALSIAGTGYNDGGNGGNGVIIVEEFS